MVLGYCMACERLVALRKGPPKWGSRQRAWFPIEHDADGKRCPGFALEIKDQKGSKA